MTNTFTAGDEVEDLAYDFTKYIPGAAATGEIPEPSSKQIARFFSKMAQTARDMMDTSTFDPDNPAELLHALDSLDEAQFTKMNDGMVAAYAHLCGNTPSEATLKKLPWRVQQAFFGWVQGHFLPNLSTGATSPSAADQNGAGSTTTPAASSA